MEPLLTPSPENTTLIKNNKDLKKQIRYFENYESQLIKYFNSDPKIIQDPKPNLGRPSTKDGKAIHYNKNITKEKIHLEIITTHQHIKFLNTEFRIEDKAYGKNY